MTWRMSTAVGFVPRLQDIALPTPKLSSGYHKGSLCVLEMVSCSTCSLKSHLE